MPALTARLIAPEKGKTPADRVSVTAVLTNKADRPVRIFEAQAKRASLALQVEDQDGQRVLLRPPSTPGEQDLVATTVEPGASLQIAYSGFLDAQFPPGRYRVRYHAAHPALGGSSSDPLFSAWIDVDVVRPFSPWASLLFLWKYWKRLLEWLCKLLGCHRRCRRVLSQEVDRLIAETISGAPPGYEAWNGTFAWHARFHIRIEEANCRVVITIRIRVSGSLSDSQREVWQAAVAEAWGQRFKSCADLACCPSGMPILMVLQVVTAGEHYVVTASPGATLDITTWGVNDAIDIRHEAGHMLGNKEEYFTVDGVPFGPARQANGNIMNNPANLPVAAHYWLIQESVNSLLGESGTTKAVAEAC